MKRARFTKEQIIAVLKEALTGGDIRGLCRKHRISPVTFYRWRSKHGSPELAEASRLKRLEEENRRLRSLVTDLTLSNQALKQVVSKKW